MSRIGISRREFLKWAGMTAGLAASGSLVQACAPQAPPTPAPVPPTPVPTPVGPAWATAPTVSKPGKLYFILYPWGTTEEELVEQFEADWGVDVEMLVESVNEPVYTKSNTMYAAGEQLDTIKTTFNWLAEWVEAGLLEPLDGLPGLDEYKKDMNDLCLQSAEFQGKTWGLPYYQTFFIAAHFEDHFDAGGIEAPPKTYDELVDQALKLKKDGVAEYPILWMGGMGTQHIMFIYFVLVHNWGGTVFDKDAKLTLGPGSKAREALAWWQKTFQEWKISAPESLELRFIPATKAFWTEKYSYLMFVHHYYMSMLNSEVESPIVGRAHNWLLPNDGATLGYTDLYTMCSTTGSKEWAWMLLQYLGGKTKDGQYTIAKKYAIKSMLGTGFDVVNKDPAVLELWRKWTDVDLNLQQGNLATAMPVAAPAVMRPWYGKWQDAGQVSIQKCLTGEITADEACDEMIAKHEEVAG